MKFQSCQIQKLFSGFNLKLPYKEDEFNRISTNYFDKIPGHANCEITELTQPLEIIRLRILWPADLKKK